MKKMTVGQALAVILIGLVAVMTVKSFTRATRPPVSVDGILADARAKGLTRYDVLEQELPEQFLETKRYLPEMVNDLDSIELAPVLVAMRFDEPRANNAALMRQAPDALLKAMIAAQHDMLALVATRETAEECARYLKRGATIIFETDSPYALAYDAAGAAIFRAMGAATRTPVEVAAATDADWAAFAHAYLANGGTTDELKGLFGQGLPDQARCPAELRLYRTLLDLDGPLGHRVRADLGSSVVAPGA